MFSIKQEITTWEQNGYTGKNMCPVFRWLVKDLLQFFDCVLTDDNVHICIQFLDSNNIVGCSSKKRSQVDRSDFIAEQ